MVLSAARKLVGGVGWVRGVMRVGWCDLSLLGDGGGQLGSRESGGFTMNFGVFVGW